MPPEPIRTLPFGTGLVLLRNSPPIVTTLRRWSQRYRLSGRSFRLLCVVPARRDRSCRWATEGRSVGVAGPRIAFGLQGGHVLLRLARNQFGRLCGLAGRRRIRNQTGPRNTRRRRRSATPACVLDRGRPIGLATCPVCQSDEIDVAEDLKDGRRRLTCDHGHEWVIGRARLSPGLGARLRADH